MEQRHLWILPKYVKIISTISCIISSKWNLPSNVHLYREVRLDGQSCIRKLFFAIVTRGFVSRQSSATILQDAVAYCVGYYWWAACYRYLHLLFVLMWLFMCDSLVPDLWAIFRRMSPPLKSPLTSRYLSLLKLNRYKAANQ